MSEERNKRIKKISNQFNEEIIRLAEKTEKEIQQMVDDATSAFETEYNWEKQEGRLIALYESILSKKAGDIPSIVH